MSRPRIVIVGAGFGGLAAAAALKDVPAEVVVIDRSNHHLFQPLLYQVATAGLAPTQIASPIRSILARQDNARVILGEVTGVDAAARTVRLGDRSEPYDHLVLATGASHGYFGHAEWARFAPGLKALNDALGLRGRILLAFERAEVETDPAERARLLTFLVIGGGPTGVELAGAIAELAHRALARDFRAIRGEMARVVLIEAGPRLLPSFPAALSAYAARALGCLGVEVRVGRAVTRVQDGGVELGEEPVAARTILWAAGVMASPAADWLGAAKDRAGRVLVEPDLSLPGAPEVFVIGDAAHLEIGGVPLPGIAPVAKQQGAYVARVIAARVAGRRAPRPFRYRDAGALATVGRKSAVVAMGPLRLTGAPAWLLWSAAHIWFLIGFRNRLAVTLDWLWAYLTFERGARLITGAAGAPSAAPAPSSSFSSERIPA
jgi:NADH dehydrogenase FAD-containing subunit